MLGGSLWRVGGVGALDLRGPAGGGEKVRWGSPNTGEGFWFWG